MIRAAALFLPRGRLRAAAAPAFPPRALVLGDARGLALAGALGGELRARLRAPAALVTAWAPQAMMLAPLAATPSARSLAARLQRRDLAAVARGRLAWLPLGGSPGDALAVAVRAVAAVDVPAVLAVTGPRPRELDRMLSEFDLIVVSEPDGDCGAAALAAAAVAGAVTCAPPVELARLLALSGWGSLRGGDELRRLVGALA